MILVEETISRFGYSPDDLLPQSHKLMVVQCPECGEIREVMKQYYRNRALCKTCSARQKFLKIAASRKIYPSRSAKQLACQKRRLQTIEGHATHSLRCLLRHALRNSRFTAVHSGCFRRLGYTKKQLVAHLKNCLEKGCCICKQAIKEKWHIAHLRPASFAENENQVIELFRLENLDVAHPICNYRIGARQIKRQNRHKPALY